MKRKKNPAAVALGRLGGQVTGVRKGFAALSPEERSERAREGVRARWEKWKKRRRAPA